MNTLERTAHDARAQSQLPAGSDPQQPAFELEGALLTANWYFHLYADRGYLGRARRAVQARLASEATPTGRRALRPAPQTGETGATGERTTQGSSDDEARHRLFPVGDGGRGLGP
jgi:hypothetical protein